MGQTGITVVGQKRDLMIPVQKPGHLKHMRGGKGAFRKMRHFLPVHQKPQASGPLRFQKDALPRLGNEGNAPGQPRFSLKGIFSGKTGGDGRVFIKSILRVSKRRVRVPLVLPQILMPDSVFIQSAGKPHGINLPVSDIGLPEAGYVIVHLSLLSAAARQYTILSRSGLLLLIYQYITGGRPSPLLPLALLYRKFAAKASGVFPLINKYCTSIPFKHTALNHR